MLTFIGHVATITVGRNSLLADLLHQLPHTLSVICHLSQVRFNGRTHGLCMQAALLFLFTKQHGLTQQLLPPGRLARPLILVQMG